MKFRKLMHRFAPVLLVLTLLVGTLPAAGAAGSSASFAADLARLVEDTHEPYFFGSMKLTLGSRNLEVDGRTIAMDVAPMVEVSTSRVLLPIRYVAEQAGARVDFDSGTQTVLITTPQGEEISCVVGEKAIRLDGVSIASDTPTTAYNNRTYVPIRLVSETLGMDVQWVQESQSILITAPWQTARVLVWSDTQPDTLGAETVLHNGGSLWVLQYGSPTEAKEACEALQARGYTASGDLYIPPVEDLTGSSVSASGGHNSWGVDKSAFNEFIDNNAGQLTGDALVAVVDTGVDDSISALKGRVVNGRDFVDGDSDPDDEHYHGTHIASTIVDCVGDLDVDILAVRVLDENGGGSTSQVVAGVSYAAEQGADVINLSLGGPKTSSTVLDQAIERAVAKGTTVVVSAGNESSDAKYYCPSHLGTERGVICVGAVDSSDKQAYFSNYGNSVDIKAPGVNIKAYVPGGSLKSLNGTSMSAPHVSAASAVFYLFDHEISPAQVEDALKQSARNGILDLSKAELPGGSTPVTPEPEKKVVAYTYSVDKLSLAEGETARITVTAQYSDGSTADVTSKSGLYCTDISVATVASDGTVTAKQAGSTYLSMASAAGISIPAPVPVTVTAKETPEQPEPSKKIVAYRWSASRLEMEVGQGASIALYAVYDDGSEQDVTRSSKLYLADPSIAEVDGNLVYGRKEGSTLLVFAFAGTSANISVPTPIPVVVSAAQPEPQPETYQRLFWAIKQDNTSVDSAIDSLSLSKGRSVQIAIYGETTSGALVDLTSECVPFSSDESVATIKNGKLTAVGSGTCYLWLEKIPNVELELPPLLLLDVK
ncbi:hypothetical protein B5G43_12175 [Flavonifractor sp. An92]|uniref:S8 family serine peptidase n=1 Tax=Flavonifractor sp. An92 TaxID=1965666 RepID=UPI000B37B396|nr:S8 family serine peptidase [Flavonifractor sp. An92]OUN05661.1 hypothetical protein B5G43_12175 [Flavonifractor sp. An92]